MGRLLGGGVALGKDSVGSEHQVRVVPLGAGEARCPGKREGGPAGRGGQWTGAGEARGLPGGSCVRQAAS